MEKFKAEVTMILKNEVDQQLRTEIQQLPVQ